MRLTSRIASAIAAMDVVETVEALLSELRGSRVRIRVPQRGDKKTLQETVARNAEQALALQQVQRAGGKRQSVADFLHARPLVAGCVLG